MALLNTTMLGYGFHFQASRMKVVQIRPGPFSEEDILHWFPLSATLTSTSDLTWIDDKPTLPRCNFQNLRQPLLVNLKSSQVWFVVPQPDQLWQSIPCDSRKGLWGSQFLEDDPLYRLAYTAHATSIKLKECEKPSWQDTIIHDLCRKSCPLNLFDRSRILKIHGKWMFSGYLTSPSWRGTILWKDLAHFGDCSKIDFRCAEMFWTHVGKWTHVSMTSWKSPL